ncbi:MAG: radical SAM family heme chaperone HemW [Trueperella sp.]|nr:radical SAM family heme chaperone HemW [Trueperella sp.]
MGKRISAYVHIPFCQTRCGYCDFNTYTNLEFGGPASAQNFAETICQEIALSVPALTDSAAPNAQGPQLDTVFFGGGTPSMLPAADLIGILARLQEVFGPASEITTEANPETVDAEYLAQLKAAGFTRISFGMQSAVPHVLRTLDRVHTPGQVERAVQAAQAVGLDYSLDLIYGTPGESGADWRQSLETAIELEPGHISAYGLTIEPGTKMGRQLARGEIPAPDPDLLADRYLQADQILTAAGYQWYEVSNWARPGKECQHNLVYWQDGEWWGYGPGAHSHIAGTRFWNRKHPIAYAQLLAAGALPVAEYEQLTAAEQREEHIMLGIRLGVGIEIPEGTSATTVYRLCADGLVDAKLAENGRLVLTPKGRLLADTVIRQLW